MATTKKDDETVDRSGYGGSAYDQANFTDDELAGAAAVRAAAEAGVGLALVILLYRNRHKVDLDDLNLLKG